MAALELKFGFPYADHFTCSQREVKCNKTLHLLLQGNDLIEFGGFLQLLIAELKPELLLLQNYLLGDKRYRSKCDDLKRIGYNKIDDTQQETWA